MTYANILHDRALRMAFAAAACLGMAACTGGSETSQSSTATGSTTGASTTDATGETDTTDATGETDATVPCGDELPPIGSMCENEDELCAPDSDPCKAFGIAICTDGVWVRGEVEPGDPMECTPVPCGEDDVPPEGSLCTTEGESCAPFKDPCTPYTDAICTDGSWEYTYIGPGDPDTCGAVCDPENLPEEGSTCSMEGEFCSPGCDDPCQFCNVLECSGGAWQALEVAPAECLSCEDICPSVVAAECEGGPPDLKACVDGCMDLLASECKIEFNVTLACAGATPTFTCDDADLPLVNGCEDPYAELYACSMP